ncbi:hypothetical protein CMESO_512 (nucleomorph) [Chroomonas mesostigmatica CCMP1168]|uniref:Uncharacterized protein n=1 Tax=Chroomonas mesostigmatica CCMP1168 TaxID=1195612 RepID=J7G6I0_9CRYP|nr:hypothetical protein CMESO_512 [Chroomonas mesostigmatica CCMP1168]
MGQRLEENVSKKNKMTGKHGKFLIFYQKIIFKISNLKRSLFFLKNKPFKKYCEIFLGKKLFNLGLLVDPNLVFDKKITIKNFLNRRLFVLALKKKFGKNYKDVKFLCKKKRLFLNSSPILKTEIMSLLSRKMESRLSFEN